MKLNNLKAGIKFSKNAANTTGTGFDKLFQCTSPVEVQQNSLLKKSYKTVILRQLLVTCDLHYVVKKI